MKKTYLVIGLDTFGISVAEELTELGADVIALDIKEDAVNRAASHVNNAVIGDSTDYHVLREIGAQHVDLAIVSIPGNVQNSILTTMILSDMKVPKIIVKVDNDYHAKVAEKVGATEVISSEKSAGRRLARKILSDNVLDYYNITDDYGVYEIIVGKEFVETTILEMDIRNRYDVTVLLIKRGKETILPKAENYVKANDIVIVVGKHNKISKFQQRLV